jgi:hypothetical protein
MAIFLVFLFLVAVAIGSYVVVEIAGALSGRDAADEQPAIAQP